MGGGLLQLAAYGSENQYIHGNPQITFFKIVYKRHTNFAMETIEVPLDGPDELSFGNSIRLKAKIPRNGDLIAHMYFRFKIPDSASNDIRKFYWTRQLGLAIIDYVNIYIGGQRIETLYGSYLDLTNQLTVSKSKQSVFADMIGDNSFMSYLASYKTGYYPGFDFVRFEVKNIQDDEGEPTINRKCITKFYNSPAGIFERHFNIPLNFWFVRNPGLALPLIALQYHDVELEFQLKPAKDLYTILEDDKPYYYYEDENNLYLNALWDNEKFINNYPIPKDEALANMPHYTNKGPEYRLILNRNVTYDRGQIIYQKLSDDKISLGTIRYSVKDSNIIVVSSSDEFRPEKIIYDELPLFEDANNSGISNFVTQTAFENFISENNKISFLFARNDYIYTNIITNDDYKTDDETIHWLQIQSSLEPELFGYTTSVQVKTLFVEIYALDNTGNLPNRISLELIVKVFKERYDSLSPRHWYEKGLFVYLNDDETGPNGLTLDDLGKLLDKIVDGVSTDVSYDTVRKDVENDFTKVKIIEELKNEEAKLNDPIVNPNPSGATISKTIPGLIKRSNNTTNLPGDAGSNERIKKSRERASGRRNSAGIPNRGLKKWIPKIRKPPNPVSQEDHISNFLYGSYFNKTWDFEPLLDINYIFLDNEERRVFAEISHHYLIEQVVKVEKRGLQGDSSVELEAYHPVKEILFTASRDDNSERNEWLNNSTLPVKPGLGSAFDWQDHWWSHSCDVAEGIVTNDLILEKGPIIFEHPEDGQIVCDRFQELIFRFGPNGEAGDTALDSSDTILGFTIQDRHELYTLDILKELKEGSSSKWIFTPGADIPRIDNDNYEIYRTNPLVGARIKFNGQVRQEMHRHEFYSQVQAYQFHTANPNQPVYVYSFALNPEKYQPSGACNMSRIKSIEFDLKLKNTPLSKIQKVSDKKYGNGLNTTREWLYNVDFFIIGYNILNIMGGLGGLVFGN